MNMTVTCSLFFMSEITFCSVRAFIDAGVDPNEANSQGKTCSDFTQNDGTRKLLKKLKEKSEL